MKSKMASLQIPNACFYKECMHSDSKPFMAAKQVFYMHCTYFSKRKLVSFTDYGFWVKRNVRSSPHSGGPRDQPRCEAKGNATHFPLPKEAAFSTPRCSASVECRAGWLSIATTLLGTYAGGEESQTWAPLKALVGWNTKTKNGPYFRGLGWLP